MLARFVRLVAKIKFNRQKSLSYTTKLVSETVQLVARSVLVFSCIISKIFCFYLSNSNVVKIIQCQNL